MSAEDNRETILQIVETSQSFQITLAERELIRELLTAVGAIENETFVSRRAMLAAAFDLVVTAEYYRSVGHIGWVYCPEPTPALYYPYTNICPRCGLDNRFHFQAANKPGSGVIGRRTSRLLALFLSQLFSLKGLSVAVLKGSEPVDIIFIDHTTTPVTVMFAEIKAAPLLTLPLYVTSQSLIIDTDNETQAAPHRITDFSQLFGTWMNVFVPTYDAQSDSWLEKTFPVGIKQDAHDTEWAYRGLTKLLTEDPTFFMAYAEFWAASLQAYGQRSQESVYWLTNACGHPSPRPDTWPARRTGSGYETISDSKTSVGMDRTDDIKKAIYQVIKLGSDGKPVDNLKFLVGVVSNIHAVRHFEDYLETLKDIIWTRSTSTQVKTASDLSPDTALYNLFDGIIAITQTFSRDEWINKVFDF